MSQRLFRVARRYRRSRGYHRFNLSQCRTTSSIKTVFRVSARLVLRPWCATMKLLPRKSKRWGELIGAAQKCEAMTAEVHNAIAYMRDTAAAYREEAKKIFKRIEDCAL